MSYKSQNNTQDQLKQLWGRNVPPLTSDEIELSIKVWQKIEARRQREQKSLIESQTELNKT